MVCIERVEEIFGWVKTVGLMRKVRHRGQEARGLDVHLERGDLQPGENGQSAGSYSMRNAARPSAGWALGSNLRVRENSPVLHHTGNLVSKSGFFLY